MKALERRLRKLEAARGFDSSGYHPDSPESLAFWDRQVYNYVTGLSHVPLTVGGVRAIMKAWGDPRKLDS
jgi:hypothetical protein